MKISDTPLSRPDVVLHVGLPKTGTTHLQHVITSGERAMRKSGWGVPATRAELHRAGRALQGWDREAALTWDEIGARMTDRSKQWLISDEGLAMCSPVQARQVIESVASVEPLVIVAVRNLGRFLPSAWQQRVKEGYDGTFETFLADIRHPSHGFWNRFGVQRVIAKWVEVVGSERVTAVIVPGATANDSLWQRFSRATGLPESLPQHAARNVANSSLGPVQAEALRRVNRILKGNEPPEFSYRQAVRLGVVPYLEVLSGENARIEVPTSSWDWVIDSSAADVDYLDKSGISIVGGLAELQVAGQAPSEDTPAGDSEVAWTLATLVTKLL